jgi:glycosyltransferase involved in cell wall biosynthesis
MKILHVAPISYMIPPHSYGGTERIIYWLAKQQVEDGHVVIIMGIANPSVASMFKMRTLFHKPPRSTIPRLAEGIHALYSLFTALQDEYDIVHNHLMTPGLQISALLNKVHVPTISTLHYDPPLATREGRIYSLFKHPCVALSKGQAELLGKAFNIVAIIPHGIELSEYPFDDVKDDYLLYLGAIYPARGVHIAVHIAKRARQRLLIAGPIRDPEYFAKVIKPQVDGRIIKYLGNIGGIFKKNVLKKAKALIFPSLRYEAFGLALLEAMACGTPIITFNRHPMSEIVENGKTGYLVKSVEEMIEATKLIDKVDPKNCRKHVETNFSAKVMEMRYLALYKKICG